MQNKKEKAFAGFLVRFFAYLTDMFILGILLFGFKIPAFIQMIGNPNGLYVRDVFFSYSIYDIVVFLLTSLYFILMTYYCGATVGKMLLRIKVVSVEERDLKFSEVVVREIFGKYLSAFIVCIGYLMIIPDEQKRALHDRIADTRVIYVHEEGAYKRFKEIKAKEDAMRAAAKARYNGPQPNMPYPPMGQMPQGAPMPPMGQMPQGVPMPPVNQANHETFMPPTDREVPVQPTGSIPVGAMNPENGEDNANVAGEDNTDNNQ